MTRDEALELVHEKIRNENLRRHMLATEAVMMALASRLGHDPQDWGLAGLVHDCDLEEIEGDPLRHGKVGAEILGGLDVDEEICHAVLTHPGRAEEPPTTTMEIALRAADQATGLITAAALIHPTKAIASLKVKSLKKRMKEKRFAAGVDRDAIRLCEQIDLPLDEFLDLAARSMGEIADQLELDGRLASKIAP
jgi:putative nucleotidyltransferase with HDIG domain